MTNITLLHNPAGGTSRNTLALIRHAGIEPTGVAYLKTPPPRERLVALIAQMGYPVRAVLRDTAAPCAELKLTGPKWTDDELLDFMTAHPGLINRPIVETPLGTRLCRPSEAVLELLPVPRLAGFTAEDGAIIVDSGARRV